MSWATHASSPLSTLFCKRLSSFMSCFCSELRLLKTSAENEILAFFNCSFPRSHHVEVSSKRVLFLTQLSHSYFISPLNDSSPKKDVLHCQKTLPCIFYLICDFGFNHVVV